MKKKGLKKCIVMAIILTQLFATCGTSYAAVKGSGVSSDDFLDVVGTYNIDGSIPTYKEYVRTHKDAENPAEIIYITAEDVVRYEEDGKSTPAEIFENYEGYAGKSVYTSENGLVEYRVNVLKTGNYKIKVDYYTVPGKNSEIERSFFVDGKLPYKELSMVTFQRIWKIITDEEYKDENGVTVKVWEKDNQGNDVKPECIETPEWQTRYVYDSDGYITEPLSVYLTEGEHILSILSIKEPMLIGKIELCNEGDIRSYKEIKAEWDKKGVTDTKGCKVLIEGEYASKMSSQMLHPKQDQASCEVNPASAKELLNNVIGGDSWNMVGEWIEWEFEIPENGYYEIAFHDKQNFSRGIAVSRRITIDGKVPFEELNDHEFEYAQNWRTETLSDKEGVPYKFYFEKGTHTIRMEVVLGEFSEIVGLVEEAVVGLNEVYRSIIKITGVSPDTYRDYQIESSLPNLTEKLTNIKQTLVQAVEMLDKVAGKNSEKRTVLITMIDQLDELIEDNDYFVRVIGTYKVNMRACGNWIAQVIRQPLAIDRISIYSPNESTGIKKAGFFARLGHEIKRLFYSFIIDYNQIGNVVAAKDSKEVKTLTLWIGSGRDQANVIKGLIDESFTNRTGINVNVQLVDMSTLLKASLIGEGPDVAIQVANTNGAAGSVLGTGNDTPVNYGIRDAVLDLTMFEDYEEVLKRFPEAAYTQFQFDDALYALPETITFPVMFYRKDILKEIGLEIPKTWDDVKVAMTVLSKNQMEFGMLPTEQTFASILYQNGGEYYTEDGTASALDSDIAINAFKVFCNYYTDYKLDRETSVEERFRTGECPLMIADYTVYNNFAVSAPDIAGLWGFTIIPGTKKEDGSVDHTVASTGLASMIMSDTEYPEEAWEFIKWWTDEETQTKYGREMESLMGSAARVPTANYAAFTKMPWPVVDYKALQSALETVKGIRQVPGGYFSWRNVNNAFYTVVTETDTASPREELMDKVIYINAEIEYKREELNLNK